MSEFVEQTPPCSPARLIFEENSHNHEQLKKQAIDQSDKDESDGDDSMVCLLLLS